MRQKTKKQALRLSLGLAIGIASTFLGVWIQSSNLGSWAELRTYDLRFRLRGPLRQSREAPVTILAIDENTLSRIPDPFMLWHKHFAKVIGGLAAAGAGAIGVDFIFSDVAAFDAEGQLALSQALLEAGAAGVPVILAYRVRTSGVEQPPESIRLPALAAGHDFAYVNLTTDSDDFVRRQQIAAPGEDQQLESSFAHALAAAFAAKKQKSLGKRPGDQRTILINFRGPAHFKRVSFVDALDAANKDDREFLKNNFGDRIVLIGRVGESGDEDLHSTPHYYWIDREQIQGTARTPGIEIHANVIATLLEGNFIQPLEHLRQLLITFAMTSLVAFSCCILPPFTALIASAVLVGGYLLFAFYWVFERGWWLFVVSPVVGGIVAGGLTEVANFVLEGREKRRLRNLFKSYVNDQVIEKILEAPESLALKGDTKRITVLFADIRGFTTRSEGISAEELVSDLNQYFKAMVEAIQSHRGMVDKFIGDGIMALFGTPVKDPDAALHAVQAAQHMLAALKTLNEQLAVKKAQPIGIGIGIHTGEAVVGNIGSPQKMEYTAIGDVVNTASRIEGMTRKLDADILVTGDTFEALQGKVPATYVGDHELKGRKARVPIYRID